VRNYRLTNFAADRYVETVRPKNKRRGRRSLLEPLTRPTFYISLERLVSDRRSTVVAAMQHRGPQRTRRRDPKPPFQNSKGMLLSSGEREPLTGHGSGLGTRDRSGMKDRSSTSATQPANIMGWRLASVPFYLKMTPMPLSTGRTEAAALCGNVYQLYATREEVVG
jgi:hypothetical protein